MPLYENTQPPYSVAPGEFPATIVSPSDGTTTLGAGNYSERVAIADPYGMEPRPVTVATSFATVPSSTEYDIYGALDDSAPPAAWILLGKMTNTAGDQVTLQRVGPGGESFRFICVKEITSPGVKTTVTVRQ